MQIGIDQPFALGPIGIRSEVISFATSFVRIQENKKIIVALNRRISLHDLGHYFLRLGIEASYANEQGVLVPANAHLGLFSYWFALVRLPLDKVLGNWRFCPAGVSQVSVDNRSSFDLSQKKGCRFVGGRRNLSERDDRDIKGNHPHR